MEKYNINDGIDPLSNIKSTSFQKKGNITLFNKYSSHIKEKPSSRFEESLKESEKCNLTKL